MADIGIKFDTDKLKKIAREALNNVAVELTGMSVQECIEKQMPTGHWITHNANNPFEIYSECSDCGSEQSMSVYLKYCPNCGQRMEWED